MIPVTQTIMHDPANGKHGNCFSAVLASLLHLPIDTVPVFSNNDTWVRDLNAWLRPHGLAFLTFERAAYLAWIKDWGIEGMHCEVAGKSPRFDDAHHACVGLDGEVTFDPHPSRTGLNPVQSVGVFLALEPWRAVR